MDLNTISEIVRPQAKEAAIAWREGDALLASGTWLFSEPQPHLNRLIDFEAFAWDPLKVSAQGLDIATTCLFQGQGFRIAVHRVTGEVAVLQSVQAVDAGTVINPMQCRGQIEGAIAQGLGWTLIEKMVFDDGGRIINPTFRNYRIPAYVDIPAARSISRKPATLSVHSAQSR